jgi:hypothetical protein
MARAEPYLGRFLSRFLLAVVPGLAASALAVFVLYAVHLSRMPEPIDRLTGVVPETASVSDGLSSEERRELTRQMLKARRENPEVPALVRPTPRPATSAAAQTGDTPASAADEKVRAERTATVTPSAAAPRPARLRAEPVVQAPAVVMAAVPPPAAAAPASPIVAAPPATASVPSGTAVGPAPTPLPSVEVNTSSEPPPEQHGFAHNVFSSFSYLAGTAANATGNTVNWVIDLPGKAISAGGRLIGRDATAANPPANSPPPAEAPPPKRNYL